MVVPGMCLAGIGLTLLLAAPACAFDTSTQGKSAIDSGSSLGGRVDATPPELCPADIHIELQVGGITTSLASTEPYIHTLIGDTVELSAIGTCTRAGPIEYTWVIGTVTDAIGQTALPNLQSETISIYPSKPGEFGVMLHVSDGSQTESKGVYAFEAHGFQKVVSYPGNTIRDLSAGVQYLWVGADNGAYRGELASPLGAYPSVNDLYAGVSLPNKIQLHETASGDHVWFGTDDPAGEVYRLPLPGGMISSHDTTPSARTKAIRSNAQGVRVATSGGVVFSADSDTFVVERNEASDALSLGATGLWAGKARLYPLPVGAPTTVFGGGDNQKIQSLADDGTELWIGGNGKGVARLENGLPPQVYTPNNSALTHTDVRSLIVDATGDIWAATKGGVSRFKADRQVWVPMAMGNGIDDLDLEVITIDERSQRRAIYVGGSSSLSVMRIP